MTERKKTPTKKPPTKKPAPKKPPTKKPAPKRGQTRGLGRGLSALMSDLGVDNSSVARAPKADPKSNSEPKATKTSAPKTSAPKTSATKMRGVATLAIDQIVRNPDQPRRYFDKALLEELTSSIAKKGVLQPILVRPVPTRSTKGGATTKSGKAVYQIVAGERRWQASLKAGLDQMPALIRELSDQDVLEIGVVENVQRADLNPIEEALAYRALVDQFGRTQNEIATAIGKSRPHIANMLRLLSLPKRAQEALQQGEISTGHARAVIAAPDPEALVEHIIDKQLSVRDAEAWVRRIKAEERDADVLRPSAPEYKSAQKSADITALERDLSDKLGLAVVLNHKGPSGELRLRYKTAGQLDMILAILGKT